MEFMTSEGIKYEQISDKASWIKVSLGETRNASKIKIETISPIVISCSLAINTRRSYLFCPIVDISIYSEVDGR